MITFLILFARFLGMCQRALGRAQTHCLTSAQGLGWKPGEAMMALALERRQAALAVRHYLRQARKEKRREARARRRRK